MHPAITTTIRIVASERKLEKEADSTVKMLREAEKRKALVFPRLQEA